MLRVFVRRGYAHVWKRMLKRCRLIEWDSRMWNLREIKSLRANVLSEIIVRLPNARTFWRGPAECMGNTQMGG